MITDTGLIAQYLVTLGVVSGIMSVICEKIDVIWLRMCGIKE